MTDYLEPVGPWGKRFALIATLVCTFLFAAMTAIVTVSTFNKVGPAQQEKSLWLGVCFVGFLTFASGWLSVRLLSGRSANGVTLMPVWFIEVFGLLFAAGLCLLLFTGHWHGIMPGMVDVVGAMLLIRRQVRRRLRDQESEGGADAFSTHDP